MRGHKLEWDTKKISDNFYFIVLVLVFFNKIHRRAEGFVL